MDTMQMLGYDKREVFYESDKAFICKAQSKAGKTYLIKAFKDEQPTIEQLVRLENEYIFLKEQSLFGVARVCELIKNYKGHLLIMEDEGGIPLIDAPVFRNIRQGDKELKQEALQWILQIMIEMAEIVGGLHEHRLIHKAINPSIFLYLPASNKVTMIDIGLATEVNQSGSEENNEMLLSALPYISPEQTGRLGRKIDYRTDFYSLGVTMYELITGQRPFTTDRPIELVHCHIAERPYSPHHLNRNIPEMLSDIIMKLLEKASEQRYQSATGLIHDLNQCLEQLSATDDIVHFELGEYDSSSGLQIFNKLYGRSTEKVKIKNLYRQVANGAVRVLMIGGYPGVGKTSIVQEICRPLAEMGGYFASGKAEQYQINLPYFIFTQTVQDLVNTLLQESDHLLEQWKESLLRVLKDNGQVLLDIVPELAAIIGPQPSVSELSIAESNNRFFHTFGNFIQTIAQKSHPLTIFLDDLQWCDRPSMELVKYLITRDDIESLVLIGCYRDNEIKAGHPLGLFIEELNKSEKVVSLQVQPLAEKYITEMLTDILHLQEENVKPLVEIVGKKSHGNPLFIRKLLTLLNEENYLRYNRSMRNWDWDIQGIESVDISDNIVEVLINQLMKLPIETLNLLKQAALIGSTFDLKVLAEVSDMSAIEVSDCLRHAIDGEIIQAIDNAYFTMNSQKILNYDFEFKFAHDRVQQACVEMMDPEQQRLRHLKIGRIMKQNTPKNKWQDCAMEIVNHLNEGIDSLEAEEERYESARLNLWACQKAKVSSAFYLALRYIEISVSLLPEDVWIKSYELAVTIYKAYVECAYLNNEYARAEEQVHKLLLHVKSALEQAEIRCMQCTIFNYQGRLDKAIEYASQGLEHLKLRAPLTPKMTLILREMAFVRVRLLDKNRDKLLNLPKLENEKIKLALKLWNQINSAAYLYGNNNLFLLSILMQMKLTLRYGNHREIGRAYVSYAMILAVMGDLKGTYEFCELARMACVKEESYECMPTILFSSGFFGHAWNRSWQNIVEWFQKAMEEAIKYGDHHTVALAGAFMYAYKPDENIKLLAEKAMLQYPLVKQTGNKSAFNFTFLMIHRLLNYVGLTDGPFTMSISKDTFRRNGGIGIIYSEEECLEALREGNFLSGFGIYYKEKSYIHYLYDDYVVALKYLKESDKYLTHHLGTPYIVECRVCNFLVLAANISDMGKGEARKARQRLTKEYHQVRKWAKHCPVNFEHLQYMMEGELARLDGKPYKAVEMYDQAIQTARQNGFIREEALSNELAGKMFLELRKEKQAAFYMTEAYKGYQLWGAEEKIRHMADKYSGLLRAPECNSKLPEIAAVAEDLDMMSIVAASKAVTKEEQLPNLLRQIMKTVIENSGAQKAYIIFKSENGWSIEAERMPGVEETVVLQSIPLEEYSNNLPIAIINFCIRTKEYVVLGDASNIDRYNNEPYIRQNKIKSLLCMPIINQGSIEGVVYLENNLLPDVFTKERINILQVLAAQFSFSIKNVQLFSNLLAKTEEVHQAAEEVLRSDIAFLQAQIKPHFLYNAINTISAFSLDDSKKARELLANLSKYLRGSFDFKNRDKLVALRREIELVEAYLSIEKARFGDRLKVVYHIDENADCLLPPLVIQPIVENAVHHGLSGRKKGGTVEITIRNENGDIVIVVEDDGAGMDDTTYAALFEDNTQKRSGVALKNIQMRLTQIYGRGLDIERKNTGGTRVTIRIKNK